MMEERYVDIQVVEDTETSKEEDQEVITFQYMRSNTLFSLVDYNTEKSLIETHPTKNTFISIQNRSFSEYIEGEFFSV